ncbi:MAG TPA: TonB family protein [Trichormus sp.]
MEELTAPVETTCEAQEPSTISGAGVSALILRTCAERKARPISGWVLITGSFAWILGLLVANLSHETLAWCTTFLLLSGATIAWLYGKNNGSTLSLFKLGELRPIATSEGLAISFVAFSCLICSFMSIYKFAPAVPVVRRQVVDIEFVSGADAVDRHDILPGTKEKSSEKKVSSNNLISSHGRALSQQRLPSQAHNDSDHVAKNGSSTSVHQPTAVDNNRMFVAQQPQINRTQTISASRPLVAGKSPTPDLTAPISIRKPDASKAPPMVVVSHSASFVSPAPLLSMTAGGSHWQTQTVAPAGQSRAATRRSAPIVHNAATMEEVAPPEMLELTDSQGETHANELWQAGGHSNGGTGSPSLLATYLKDLHRRIKRAWVPPADKTRTAEILFRIKRTGHLTSIKLMRSSGNSESDEAAMAAIASCSPFKSLPDDYPGDFLDLEYTFNYTADRLSEMPGHQM